MDVINTKINNDTTAQSPSQIANQSFDQTYQVNVVEPVVYNSETQSLDRMVQPVTDDSILLLRQIRTILFNQGNSDGAKRQNVVINLPGAAITTTLPVSGTVTANPTTIGGIDARFQIMDMSHVLYATAIRNNLSFS